VKDCSNERWDDLVTYSIANTYTQAYSLLKKEFLYTGNMSKEGERGGSAVARYGRGGRHALPSHYAHEMLLATSVSLSSLLTTSSTRVCALSRYQHRDSGAASTVSTARHSLNHSLTKDLIAPWLIAASTTIAMRHLMHNTTQDVTRS